jgi:hypothetical protein
MKRIALALIGSAIVLGLMALSATAAWRLTKTEQMLEGILLRSAMELHTLELLESGRSAEAIEFLNRELEGNAVAAAGIPSESMITPETTRFAECILKRIKNHRERYPFAHYDPTFNDMVRRILADEFTCEGRAA